MQHRGGFRKKYRGRGQCDMGANEQNLGGPNATKVPIIDQID